MNSDVVAVLAFSALLPSLSTAASQASSLAVSGGGPVVVGAAVVAGAVLVGVAEADDLVALPPQAPTSRTVTIVTARSTARRLVTNGMASLPSSVLPGAMWSPWR